MADIDMAVEDTDWEDVLASCATDANDSMPEPEGCDWGSILAEASLDGSEMPVDPVATVTNASSAHTELMKPSEHDSKRKNKGRGKGSSMLNQAKRSIIHNDPWATASQNDMTPIEFARACKQNLRVQRFSHFRDPESEINKFDQCNQKEFYALGLLQLLVEKWWMTPDAQPSHLHKCVVRSAIAGFSSNNPSLWRDSVVSGLFAHDVPLASDEVLASKYSKHKTTIGNEIVRAASCSIESGGALWSSLLHMINWQLTSETHIPLLVIRYMRFDETPTKLRATMPEDELGFKEVEDSPFVKVMQSEFTVHMLLKRISDDCMVHIVGRVPVQLQAVDRTTTECTKRSLLNMEQTIPEFRLMCKAFPWKMLLSTSDRYASNLAAERSIQADDLSWKKLTLPCDVHKISQAHTKTADLVPEDVSGVLSTALSQRDLGSAQTLRQILRQIFHERLSIVYGAPPAGDIAAHRQQLFDLALPVTTGRSSKKVKALLNLKRRYVLAFTLNGDLQSPDIVHFCSYGCCNSVAATYAKFDKWTAWALCPHKAPHYARNRWTGQEWSLSWNILLMAHHGLHETVLEIYTGVPKAGPSLQPLSLSIADRAHGDWGTLLDEQPDSFAIVPLQDSISNLRTATARIEEQLEQEEALGGDAAKEDAKQNPGMSVEARRAFKQKSGHWSHSKPLPRLLMLLDVMQVVKALIHHFFYLGSKDFERDQQRACASGQPRKYPVVEAVQGTHLAKFFAAVGQLFRRCPSALPSDAKTMWHRCLSYRLIARSGCAMHMLLRHSHQAYPYRLFKVLAELENPNVLPMLARDAVCLHDELANDFFTRFPPESENFRRTEALACLETLAQAIQLDISGIEAKHALTRRITTFKSLQTWISSLEGVSAHWTTRQIRTERNFLEQVHSSTQETAKNKRDQADSNLPKKKGGGGGAWRAYVHINHAGVKITRQSARKIAEEFRNISAEERAYYQNIGSKGTMAYRCGYKAFGPSLARPAPGSFVQPPEVGTISMTGAIIAADLARPVELVAHVSEDFDVGLRQIATKHRKHQEHLKKIDRKADETLGQHSRDLLGTLSSTVQPAASGTPTAAPVVKASASEFYELGYAGGLGSVSGSTDPTKRICLHYLPPAEQATVVPRPNFVLLGPFRAGCLGQSFPCHMKFSTTSNCY